MKNIKFVILVFTLLFTGSVFGQSSIYSRYGLGINALGVSAKEMSLNGASTALSESEHLSSSNPAGWSSLALVRFEGGLSLTQTFQKDANGKRDIFSARFQGIRFGVPLQSDYGIVLALFLEPLTFVDYDVQNHYNDNNFGQFDKEFSGEGGLSKFGFGLTYVTPFNFALGATFDYYSGSTEYTSALIFGELSPYRNSIHKQKFDQRGIGFSVGTISSDLSKVFNSESITDFRFGFSYRYVPKVVIDTFLIVKSHLEEITTAHGVTSAAIPYTASFGMKMELHKSTTLLLDLKFAPWSNYKFNDKTGNDYTDREKIGLGIEYKDKRLKTKTFLQKLTYRGGLSYEKTKFLINGNNVNEYSISAGIGVPMNQTDILDFAIRLGQRGNTNLGMVEEKFINFGISLSFGEKWFSRRR